MYRNPGTHGVPQFNPMYMNVKLWILVSYEYRYEFGLHVMYHMCTCTPVYRTCVLVSVLRATCTSTHYMYTCTSTSVVRVQSYIFMYIIQLYVHPYVSCVATCTWHVHGDPMYVWFVCILININSLQDFQKRHLKCIISFAPKTDPQLYWPPLWLRSQL